MSRDGLTRVGTLRPTQLMYTYGIGAVVDLPHIATMVMGLDDWDATRAAEVVEDRLLLAVQGVSGAGLCDRGGGGQSDRCRGGQADRMD